MKKILGFVALVTMVLAMNSHAMAGCSACSSVGGDTATDSDAGTDQKAKISTSTTETPSDETKSDTVKVDAAGK